MRKSRVAILRGGPSDEYSVSLKTGAAVLAAIDRDHFEPIDILVTKDGEWLLEGRSRYPEHIITAVDVVFIALHGSYGEDGTLQRLLERYAVPFTGSGSYASRIAMHKGLTKAHLKTRGRDVPFKLAKHVTVTREALSDMYRTCVETVDELGPDLVVKPVSSGSSVGISFVSSLGELREALTALLTPYPEVIVEERIEGIEATCGVVEHFRDTAVYALPPVEIVPPPSATFFDHTCKYDGSTAEYCPARFDHTTKADLERAAKVVHATLGLSQYSRSDFIVTPKDIYFLEVNTLPGLTSESLMPKAVEAVGGTYRDFITHLISDAQRNPHKRPASLA